MCKIRCGWLSPLGEFEECGSYEHLGKAIELVPDDAPWGNEDEYLLNRGWVKIYREGLFGHRWHIEWRMFLREAQKSFLRPIFENPENDIATYCIYDWERENRN